MFLFSQSLTGAGSSLYNNYPTYTETTGKELDAIKKEIEKTSEADECLTTEYDSLELPEGSLAYHRIFGPILSDSRWWFSSIQFERDLLAAEANAQIAAHFVHINSGGGEAYYLDRVAETLRSCTKPIYVFIKKICASAAYYIGCHGGVVKANTQNDIIGCIGTMVSFWDLDPYFKSLGFNLIEEYASRSKLKNKRSNDLISGKPDEFRKEELDPLCEQFIADVQASRSVIGRLPMDHPILQGETYRAELAQSSDLGLIDGIITLPEAIKEAHTLGQNYLNTLYTQRRITSLL
jgi:ClpP class serine protease